MNKFGVGFFIVAIFLTFTIGQIQNAYDRIAPQALYLSLINFAALIYIFYYISFEKIISFLKTNRLFLCYSAYILISGISISIADNKPEAIITYSRYLTYFSTFFILLILTSFSKINIIDLVFKLLVISVLIESSAVIFSVVDSVIINGGEFSRSNDYRGLSGNINITAFSLVMKSPIISYYLFTGNKNYTKVLSYLCFFIVSASLFFLLTRGAFLAFILIHALIFSYRLFKHFHSSYKKIAISLIVFFVSFQVTNNIMTSSESNIIVDRVSTIKLNNEDESINQRLRFYSAAIHSIKMNPILGVGVGNWKLVSIKYDSKKMVEYTVPYYVHNDFLQIAAEIGLIGMLFFMYFILNPF
jgi:O-antigen ligase